MKCENCGALIYDETANYCVQCGSEIVLNQGRKHHDLAAELGITDEDIECANYREAFCKLRNQGLIGLLVGVAIGCFAASSMSESSGFLAWIFFPLVFGIYFAGFPYGWSLITRVTGGLAVYGSILVMLFFYGLKFAFAAMLGWAVFPFMLLYNYMKSKKKGSKARKVCTAILVLVFIVPTVIGVVGSVVGSVASTVSNKNSISTTPVETVRPVTVSSFDASQSTVTELQNAAMEYTKTDENHVVDDYGWTVSEPTQVHYILFFESDAPHREWLHDVDVSNAIIVITGYYVVEGSGISIDAWEMDVSVYPNWSYENDTLVYESEEIYRHAIRKENAVDALEYVYSEYGRSNITLLEGPQAV